MPTNTETSPNNVVELNGLGAEFTRAVKKKTGSNFSRCLHCRTCAGGCPFTQAMDPKPNGVIRMIQLGLQKEVFECPTIWICVGCHTCAVQCPMAIDIAGVMDAVRQLAVAENADISDPGIHDFHKEVIRSVERYGRTHKLEIMMRYKMIRRDWFSDLNTGIRMFAKRKLELMPSKVKDPALIRSLF
jgi:heterodisulfide reductase subunit C2